MADNENVIVASVPDFVDVCPPAFNPAQIQAKEKRKINIKKAKPVEAPVEIPVEVPVANEREYAIPENQMSFAESVGLDKPDDWEALEADKFIGENGGTIPFVAEYKRMKALLENDKGSVKSDKKEYTYKTIDFIGLDSTKSYSASLVPYDKSKYTENVGEFVYGCRVIKQKRECLIRYKFKVIKYCKKNINPLIVKDVNTGIVHKCNGGKIEIATADGVELVYAMCDLKSI